MIGIEASRTRGATLEDVVGLEFCNKKRSVLLLFAVNILLKKKKICIFAASKTNVSKAK